MKESYAALGGRFEYLNSDCGYEKWSQYLIETLKGLGAGMSGVDIGCGNGYFTRALYKAGKDMRGVDVSPEMLNKARQLASAKGVRAEFLLGDITKLKLTRRVDFAVAVNDCLNYVPPQKLAAAFSHVAGCLKPGGAFIFDISTEYKLKNVLGNNLFAEDLDDITYLWFNSFSGDRVTMDITVFTPAGGGLFRRDEERHVQYVHRVPEVTRALEGAGFEVLRTEGHLGAPLKEDSLRANFICTLSKH